MGSGRSRPNVVLMISDQQRADTMPGLRRVPIHTPHLEWLMGSSTHFERAFCTSPMCSPARSSILTGLFPHATGMVANHQERPISNEIHLAPDVKVLADYLKPLNYVCAYTGKWHLGTGADRRGFTDFVTRTGTHDCDIGHPVQNQMLSFARKIGIRLGGKLTGNDLDKDTYDQRTDVGTSLLPLAFHRSMREATQAAGFIRSMRGEERPFALVYSCHEPHPPFACPRPFDRMYDPETMPLPETRRDPAALRLQQARNDWQLKPVAEFSDGDLQRMWAAYCGSVSYVDHLLGILLEALVDTDQLENTLLIFTSDHGEMLGSHGFLRKGSAFYEELVNVPLLVRPPGGLAAGHRTRQLVSQVDLVPTIVGWCGGDPPAGLHGTDIRTLSEGGNDPVRQGLAMEFHSSNWGEPPTPMRGWRTDDRKYIETVGGDDELYNLSDDPLETRNLISEAREAAFLQNMQDQLRTWLRYSDDPWPEVPQPERLVQRK